MGNVYAIDGKTALVTGASRGIGKHIALNLAKSGIDVAVGFKENVAGAKMVCDEIRSLGRKAEKIMIDFSNSNHIIESVAKVQNFLGNIDILVNNAAVHIRGDFLNITEPQWDHVFTINLKAPFLLCKCVIPSMLENNYGKIINISSIAGQRGGIHSIPYAASKAALIGAGNSVFLHSTKFGPD